MRMRVGEGIGRRHADDDAVLAADVGRHAHVAGHVVVADPHPVADRQPRPVRDVRPARRRRQRQGKSAAGAPLELLAADDALLDAERRQAGEGALVVARRQVVARLHPLDRVPVLVHVEDAEPDREPVERVDPLLPGRVERGRVGHVSHRPEALPPAEVVDAVHALSVRRLEAGHADHRIARDDRGQRAPPSSPPSRAGASAAPRNGCRPSCPRPGSRLPAAAPGPSPSAPSATRGRRGPGTRDPCTSRAASR